MMLWLSDSLNRSNDDIIPTISYSQAIENIALDGENFMKNAQFLYLVLDKDEKISTLRAISKIMFANDDFNDQEYELFTKLLLVWEIKEEDLISE